MLHSIQDWRLDGSVVEESHNMEYDNSSRSEVFYSYSYYKTSRSIFKQITEKQTFVDLANDQAEDPPAENIIQLYSMRWHMDFGLEDWKSGDLHLIDFTMQKVSEIF